MDRMTCKVMVGAGMGGGWFQARVSGEGWQRDGGIWGDLKVPQKYNYCLR